MSVLPIVCLVLLLILWRGWGKPVITRGRWRIGAGLVAIGALFAAALLAVRAQWEISVALLCLAIALLYAARSERGPYARTRRGPPPGRPREPGRPSLEESRALLGVSASATAAEIRTAYTRLMRRAHPDLGGSAGLAAQLNAARDRLLKS